MAAFDLLNIKPQMASDLASGDLVVVAGPAETTLPATDRLVCDGSVISKAEYPTLFNRVPPILNIDGGLVEYVEKENLPAGAPSGGPFHLTEAAMIATSGASFSVSLDDGVTWETFTSSGNYLWHFDAGSHLLIMVSGGNFHLIDKADLLEPSQWLTPLFTQAVQSNKGRYVTYDHWQGFFYAITAVPSGGKITLIRFSLKSVLEGNPEIEQCNVDVSGQYSGIIYDALDVANGRVLLLDQNNTLQGSSIEINWSDGSLAGMFDNGGQACGFQIPMPGTPGARWAYIGTSWIRQFNYTDATLALSATNGTPNVGHNLITAKSPSNSGAVVVAGHNGYLYTFQGGSVQLTQPPTPFSINIPPKAHFSGFSFISSYSNGGALRYSYHDYDMASERVLPKSVPSPDSHYEVVI